MMTDQSQTIKDVLSFYSSPGVLTTPGKYAALFDALPSDIPSLCGIVQGLFLHLHWAQQYGVTLSQERKDEANLRTVERQIARILEMDASPLSVKRPKEKRVIGTCRDFSTFLAAILRHKRIPARARCGFGAYFRPAHHEDHWMCEYWRPDEARWVQADAQLDRFQQAALKTDFNTQDMPPGRFLIAGDAWQKCRRGEADPEAFGIFDMHGLWFIAGNLVRDLLSLNKIELLPWDIWPVMYGWGLDRPFAAADNARLDRMADVTLAGNAAFAEVRAMCRDDRLREPPGWPDGAFGRPGV